MKIDDKSAVSKARKTKKTTLLFKNGSRIEFNGQKDIEWEAVEGMWIEQWLTKKEVGKLYPKLKKEQTMNKMIFFEPDCRSILLHSLKMFKEQMLPSIVEDERKEETIRVNEMINFLKLIDKKELVN